MKPRLAQGRPSTQAAPRGPSPPPVHASPCRGTRSLALGVLSSTASTCGTAVFSARSLTPRPSRLRGPHQRWWRITHAAWTASVGSWSASVCSCGLISGQVAGTPAGALAAAAAASMAVNRMGGYQCPERRRPDRAARGLNTPLIISCLDPCALPTFSSDLLRSL